ncbi:SDR family oxidoreductase [Nocardia sp. NPDC004568]|uniref:SDR family oxidoreductase n=1 Tax=Nocardia sp. NPDC004568 TaxID=3154551 RepID=UPI0033AD3814
MTRPGRTRPRAVLVDSGGVSTTGELEVADERTGRHLELQRGDQRRSPTAVSASWYRRSRRACPVLCTRMAVELWTGGHGGSGVDTAALGGYQVRPDLGIYHSSKAALTQPTHLAQKPDRGIRVNAVASGVVRTGEPEDIGAAVAFLASPRSSRITGETLLIDGGRMLGTGGAA